MVSLCIRKCSTIFNWTGHCILLTQLFWRFRLEIHLLSAYLFSQWNWGFNSMRCTLIFAHWNIVHSLDQSWMQNEMKKNKRSWKCVWACFWNSTDKTAEYDFCLVWYCVLHIHYTTLCTLCFVYVHCTQYALVFDLTLSKYEMHNTLYNFVLTIGHTESQAMLSNCPIYLENHCNLVFGRKWFNRHKTTTDNSQLCAPNGFVCFATVVIVVASCCFHFSFASKN